MTRRKEAVTSPLQIRLLGAPAVTFQERLLKFRSRKVLALLIYLVVTGERHNRQRLMAQFWPEPIPNGPVRPYVVQWPACVDRWLWLASLL